MAVIHQPDTASDQSSNFDSEISEAEPPTAPPLLSSSSSSNFSTQALFVLSDVLAPLLDVVFGTEEKDRMTSLLVTVMYNITPYLKNHRYSGSDSCELLEWVLGCSTPFPSCDKLSFRCYPTASEWPVRVIPRLRLTIGSDRKNSFRHPEHSAS